MSVLILLDNISGDTTTARHLDASSTGPFPDGFGVETATAVATPTTTPARAAYLPSSFYPRLERLSELVRVLAGEINLVVRSIKRKGDRLSGFPAIDVVSQYSYNLLGHAAKSSRVRSLTWR